MKDPIEFSGIPNNQEDPIAFAQEGSINENIPDISDPAIFKKFFNNFIPKVFGKFMVANYDALIAEHENNPKMLAKIEEIKRNNPGSSVDNLISRQAATSLSKLSPEDRTVIEGIIEKTKKEGFKDESIFALPAVQNFLRDVYVSLREDGLSHQEVTV